jgi:putative hydrolase of the HAD superfamily
MIKNIVFDMGGVLVKFDRVKFCRKYFNNEDDIKIVDQALFCGIEWIQYDRGIINTDQLYNLVKDRINVNLHEQLRKLIDNWYYDMDLIEGTGEVIRKLKNQGYNIYILSNTNENFHHFKKRLPGIECITDTFISCDYKILKPDLKIFRTFAKTVNINLNESLFIDDLLTNIEAAAYCGMKGIVFESPKQLEYDLIGLNIIK